MIVFPAIDIKAGKAVRLFQGDMQKVSVYSDNPVDMALRWQDNGASWLHIVDLDGAVEGSAINMRAIEKIASATSLKIQIGGGIRSLDIAGAYLNMGATRLIIGTIALEDRRLFEEMLKSFPGRIGVSLDASHGRLKTRGWTKSASANILDALPLLGGAAFIIYTDIERDGAKSGINLNAMRKLLELSRIPVIAAGGVHTLEDIKNIYKLKSAGNLEGVITGRALYENTLDLNKAITWLSSRENNLN